MAYSWVVRLSTATFCFAALLLFGGQRRQLEKEQLKLQYLSLSKALESKCLLLPLSTPVHFSHNFTLLLQPNCKSIPHLLIRAACVALARVGSAQDPLQRQRLRLQAAGLEDPQVGRLPR